VVEVGAGEIGAVVGYAGQQAGFVARVRRRKPGTAGQMLANGGPPIAIDNGSEFAGQAMDAWARTRRA